MSNRVKQSHWYDYGTFFLEDFNGASGWEITISLNEVLKRAVRETAATINYNLYNKKFFFNSYS